MNPPQIEDWADARMLPTKDQIEEERAQVTLELGHAVYRHRKAWAAAIALNRAYSETGQTEWVRNVRRDGDQRYQAAIADVKFWREEARTAALVLAALDHATVALLPPARQRGDVPPAVVYYNAQ